MDYLIPIACVSGGIWTGYLLGQFVSIKEMNRRLNSLAADVEGWRQNAEFWTHECNAANSEIDRQADIIARYQAKKPERDTNGKFTSRKARVTAELQAYVASKKAVQ